MKLGPIALIAIIILIATPLLFATWVAVTFNSFVGKDQAVLTQWAQVETQYQRKINLIPEIVAIASSYTQFERSVLENITRLRSQWQNASGINQQINNATSIDQTLYLIKITYEAYPELRASELLINVMDTLTGTENRIAVEQSRYNGAVGVLNAQIRSFPDGWVAGTFGFQPRPFYAPIPGGPGNEVP